MPSIDAERNDAALQKYFDKVFMRDDKKFYFGNDGDVSLEYDEDGDNYLRFAGDPVKMDSLFLLQDGNAESLSGNKTLSTSDSQVQLLDPDGSGRDLTLPAEDSSDGLVFFIGNTADGAEVITVKDDGGSTICTPGQNEAAIVFCDGTTWAGLVGDFA